MISRALLWLVLNETRYHYPKFYRILMHAVSAYLALLVYWLTSKSLSGFLDQAQAWKSTSYFEFLLVGELVLSIPVAIVSGVMRSIRFASNEGLIEDFSLHPRGVFYPISFVAASYLTREIVHVALILALALALFNFSLSPLTLIAIGGWVVAMMPAFFGLGLLSGAVLLRTGRGEGVVGQALNLATIFAGAYFPLTILPEAAVKALHIGSPYTVLLQTARDMAQGTWSVPWLALLIWNLALIAVGLLAVWATGRHIQRRGLPILSHP